MLFRHSPRITWLSGNTSGKTILDIGFAGGYSTTAAHNSIRSANPNSLIIPIDIDQQLVFKHKQDNSIVANGYFLPVKNQSIETVVVAELIEHLLDWTSLLQEASRVIKESGSLIITTPNPLSPIRLIKHWYFNHKPHNRSNLKTYFGAPDHIQFIEPLSLLNFLTQLNFKPEIITTKNLSLPYLPSSFGNPDFNFWPFTRLGTYTCIKAKKIS